MTIPPKPGVRWRRVASENWLQAAAVASLGHVASQDSTAAEAGRAFRWLVVVQAALRVLVWRSVGCSYWRRLQHSVRLQTFGLCNTVSKFP